MLVTYWMFPKITNKKIHLSHFSFQNEELSWTVPGFEVPGSYDCWCAHLLSTTRGLTRELSVLNSHWHLPHRLHWLALVQRELPSVNAYKSAHAWPIRHGCCYQQNLTIPPVHTHFQGSSCLLFIAHGFDNLHLFMLLSCSRHKSPSWYSKWNTDAISSKGAALQCHANTLFASVLKMLLFPICFAW